MSDAMLPSQHWQAVYARAQERQMAQRSSFVHLAPCCFNRPDFVPKRRSGFRVMVVSRLWSGNLRLSLVLVPVRTVIMMERFVTFWSAKTQFRPATRGDGRVVKLTDTVCVYAISCTLLMICV